MNQIRSPGIGILAMLAAMILLPVVDALSKSLATTYPAEQITWVRNVCHALLILPLAIYWHGPRRLRPARPLWQLARGLAFVLMTTCYIAALRFMPLAEALAIIFLYPLLLTLFSALFLGEHVGIYRWSAIVIGFIGVCLIIRPGFAVLNPGAPLAVAATLCTTTYILLTRKLAHSVPNLIMLFWPAFLGALMLAPFVPANWVPPDTGAATLMVVIGALAALVHLLMIVAYTYGETSAVAPLTYLQIVIAIALGYVMFGDFPDLLSWTGIALVVAAGAVTTVRERTRHSLDPPQRQRS